MHAGTDIKNQTVLDEMFVRVMKVCWVCTVLLGSGNYRSTCLL